MSRLPASNAPSSRSAWCPPARDDRDACGIGLVADAEGRPSRALVDSALVGLAGVRHRSAVAADGVSGDGAGVLLPIPQAFFARVFQKDFAHVPGKPDKFAGLFSWDVLNHLLEHHRLEPPLILVRKDDKYLEGETYLDYHVTAWDNKLPQVNVKNLTEHLRGGATLSLHDLHALHRPLNLFLGTDYVGETQVGFVPFGGELRLPFGRDDRVRVKRVKLERKVNNQGFGRI